MYICLLVKTVTFVNLKHVKLVKLHIQELFCANETPLLADIIFCL